LLAATDEASGGDAPLPTSSAKGPDPRGKCVNLSRHYFYHKSSIPIVKKQNAQKIKNCRIPYSGSCCL